MSDAYPFYLEMRYTLTEEAQYAGVVDTGRILDQDQSYFLWSDNGESRCFLKALQDHSPTTLPGLRAYWDDEQALVKVYALKEAQDHLLSYDELLAALQEDLAPSVSPETPRCFREKITCEVRETPE